MKTVIINGSPRKNWNTARILKEARKGAEAAGHEITYIDLYDLKYTGCRSCLGCKRRGIDEPCKCYIKDDLTPILESIYRADHLIIGSPIYFGQPTGEVRSMLERVCFPSLSYNDYSSLFSGKVDVTVFLTMNTSLVDYEQQSKTAMESYFWPFRFLNGKVEIIPICDTLQVDDYSRYEMRGFDEEHKKAVNKNAFPSMVRQAYIIGKN